MADDLFDLTQVGSGKEGLKALLRSAYEVALPRVRKKAGDIAGFAAYQGADVVIKAMKKGAEDGVVPEGSVQDQAIKIGATVGAVTNVGLAVSANVTDFMGAGKELRNSVRDLAREVDGVLTEEFGKKGSVSKLMRSKNEVIATKRSRVIKDSKSEFYGAAAGLTSRLPDIYDAMLGRQRKVEEAYREIMNDPEYYEDAFGGKDVKGKKLEAFARELSPYELVKENEARLAAKERAERAADSSSDAEREIAARRAKGKMGERFEGFIKARENSEASLTGQFDERIYNAADNPIFASQETEIAGTLTRGLTPLLQKTVREMGEEERGKPCAYDLIAALEEQSLDNDVSRVSHPVTGEGVSLGDYVYDIFRQHQKDVGGAQINERYGFKKELQEACDKIAEAINEQGINPMALVSLVGNRSVLDKHLRPIEPEALDKLLNKARAVVELDAGVDAQEYIGETAFTTKEDFREVLDGLPQDEKIFFASLFPTEVLREIGGMKDDEIKELHEKAGDDFADSMLSAIKSLAKQDVEALRHGGLTEEEGELIHELAGMIDEVGADAVKEELNGELRTELTDAVRNARGYWQDRVAGKSAEPDAKEKDGDAKDGAEKSGFVSRLRDKGGSEADRSV